MRLREVEVHHVDLAAGYHPADWPEAFSHRLLHELAADLSGVSMTLRPTGLAHTLTVGSGGDPIVGGDPHELAAWLSGRAPGDGLTVEPPDALPAVPDWI
jgi:maleylpyruvate isomerase